MARSSMRSCTPSSATEEYAEGPSLEDVEAMTRYNEELDQGRRAARRRRAAPGGRRASPRAGRRHRRPVQRGQGAGRRLLDHPGQGPRGGHRVGQARARWATAPFDRGPPDLRADGLPRGHPGRGRALRAAAAPDRGVTDRAATQRAIEAVWRIESAAPDRRLARMMRDVGVAEDLAQDALVAALEQWPRSGVPDNPGAWLMATAKHRAIDLHAPRDARSSASTRELGAIGRGWPSPRATRRPTTSATTCSR